MHGSRAGCASARRRSRAARRRSQPLGHGRQQKRKPDRRASAAKRGARCWRAVRRCPRSRSSPTTSTSSRLALIAVGIFLGGVAYLRLGGRRARRRRGQRDAVRVRRARLRGARGAGRRRRAVLLRELRPPARPLRTGLICLVGRAHARARRRHARHRPGRAPAAPALARRRRSRRAAGSSARPSCGSARTCSRRSGRHPGRVPAARRRDPRHRRDRSTCCGATGAGVADTGRASAARPPASPRPRRSAAGDLAAGRAAAASPPASARGRAEPRSPSPSATPASPSRCCRPSPTRPSWWSAPPTSRRRRTRASRTPRRGPR